MFTPGLSVAFALLFLIIVFISLLMFSLILFINGIIPVILFLAGFVLFMLFVLIRYAGFFNIIHAGQFNKMSPLPKLIINGLDNLDGYVVQVFNINRVRRQGEQYQGRADNMGIHGYFSIWLL